MTQPSDEKSANETTPEDKRARLLHLMRTGQAMSVRAGKSRGGLGNPKPRKPSMPPTPWDKDTS